MPSLTAPPLSLYVHIPWCVKKCPYCDFNSHAARGEPAEAAYLGALRADLDFEAPRVAGRTVETIFIGGGTPSLFSATGIARLLTDICEYLAVSPDAEITLEANPGTADADKFAGFRQAGVDRMSIGVQSFRDEHLSALGRIHDSQQARAAVAAARAAGFAQLNLDLMFALPGQTAEQALQDLLNAVELEPEQISWYQLTLEPNTLFHRHPPRLPDDETAWDIQREGQAFLATHGYRQYEISAYARPGFACRHNLNYWRFGDYLGLGAGAHGKLSFPGEKRIERRWKIKNPVDYMRRAGTEAVLGGTEDVPESARPLEFVMNALRLQEGFAECDYLGRTGLPPDTLEPALSECLKLGLLERNGGQIRCTADGWRLLDSVLEKFSG
ncbi:MAG TPA: radical SAM family heme chaperone HemW [Methylococcaceae bacterium]|nr:radical SAM family heme chaperone HemW [Methylococcaceae bacterium]